MTPPINLEIIESRQPWDPKAENLVVEVALIDQNLQRCRISDLAVVTFAILIEEGFVKKTQVDWFETVYVEGAKLRVRRKHEGLPALGPDGKIMWYWVDKVKEIKGAWGGDHGSGATYGDYSIDNYSDHPRHPNYEAWLQRLKQGISDIPNEAALNHPYPDVDKCGEANRLADERLLDSTINHGCYAKLKEKHETDSKLIEIVRESAERKNDVKLLAFAIKSAERNKAESKRAAQRELARIEAEQGERARADAERRMAAPKARKNKQQTFKNHNSQQKSLINLVKPKPVPQQRRIVIVEDEQPNDNAPNGSQRKKRKANEDSARIDQNENEIVEARANERAGKFHWQAESMERMIKATIKPYYALLDDHFPNGEKAKDMKRDFLKDRLAELDESGCED